MALAYKYHKQVLQKIKTTNFKSSYKTLTQNA